ncbi:hypothetical protein CAPTEDRAFT_199163 [Capitella teleta]|uniref:RING-type domain-containing protein n=1 Tax=Capitella teleta TaxID=283909 RepID=R7VDL4_CAPTE|nr:hypothetical protein CAPTEDRAFT_199163 [Capitella teleta]|eukprot:ELU16699.1 hypothetical protein CAPTEDRAFT_199163 [Capitella teleta]
MALTQSSPANTTRCRARRSVPPPQRQQQKQHPSLRPSGWEMPTGLLAVLRDARAKGSQKLARWPTRWTAETMQLTMVDSKMNPLVDGPATTTKQFWSSSSRQFFTASDADLASYQTAHVAKRRRTITGDVVDMASVLRVVEARVRTLQELTVPATASVVLPVAASDVLMLVEAFSCLVCHGPVRNPVVSACCSSLLGCEACLEQW